MKKIVHYLRMTPAILYALTINLVGYLLYVVASVLRAFALLLMLSPWAAKEELQKSLKGQRPV